MCWKESRWFIIKMRRKRLSTSHGTTHDVRDEFNSSPTKRLASSRDGAPMGNFNPQYPDSLAAFADGLKNDVMDLLGSGASALNKSISLIFPFIGYDSNDIPEPDTIVEIESTPIRRKNDPLGSKMRQSTQDALRMRCSSMWNEKKQGHESQSRAQKGGKVLLDKLTKNNSIQVTM
jgi:hypothetical protein